MLIAESGAGSVRDPERGAPTAARGPRQRFGRGRPTVPRRGWLGTQLAPPTAYTGG